MADIIKDIDYLAPELREAAEAVLEKAKARGLDIRVIETYRTPERQEELYKKGSSKTPHGWHTAGKAVDFGVFDKDGNYLGKAEEYAPIGDILAEIVEESPGLIPEELIWGGGTPSYPGWGWDWGHVEHHPGFEDTESQRWHKENPKYVPPAIHPGVPSMLISPPEPIGFEGGR